MGVTTTAGAREPIVAINVTPFVDVVLVLLVIFMATSGYIATPALEVDLPKATAATESGDSPLLLGLSATGDLYLNGEPTNVALIAKYCREVSARNAEVQAAIAADGGARHQDVVNLINLVKANGVSAFALHVDDTPADKRP